MVRFPVVLWVVAQAASYPATAQADRITGPTLARVKAATVLVDVRAGKAHLATGTGFLFQRAATDGLIVTNDHVMGAYEMRRCARAANHAKRL